MPAPIPFEAPVTIATLLSSRFMMCSFCSSRPVSAGLRWVDGSYLLFVEPRLIGHLDVVSVRVADVCREVVGAPVGPKARFLVGSSSRVHRRLVAGPDSVRALGRECDVKIFGDFAILQPETWNVIDGETALGNLIELVGHVDAKRLKHLLVKFARPFQVRDGEINMVNHCHPSFRLTVTAPRIRASGGHPRRTLAKQSRAVAVQFVICVLATSRRSIGARSGAL